MSSVPPKQDDKCGDAHIEAVSELSHAPAGQTVGDRADAAELVSRGRVV